MDRKRNVYLDRVPWREALDRLLAAWEAEGGGRPLPGRSLPTEEALGEVLAAPVFAHLSSPHYPASAMDGIAVRAEETFGANETSPLRLEEGLHFEWVDTGDPIAHPFNAVIMVEDVHELGDGSLEVIAPAAPWQHVRAVGEDVVATQLILPVNHRLRAVDIASLLSAGVVEVPVRRRPRVAVIPTGDELVEPGGSPAPGQIIESNSRLLAGLVEESGGIGIRRPICPDEPGALREATRAALAGADLVLINAGSSAGRDDYTRTVVEELGRMLVHGVDVRPGGPLILGLVDGKPVIGIPGYPVSAVLAFQLFARPLIERLIGIASPRPERLQAILARRVVASPGREEFLRVSVGRIGGRYVCAPLGRGASTLTTLVKADGIVRISPLSQGISEGSAVEVELLRPREEIDATLLAIGSHDLSLDVLANRLADRFPAIRLSSGNVGSMGGIVALKRGEAHVAGMHLLDPETGEYNTAYLRRYLPGERLLRMRVAIRKQGLLVARGNPKGIGGLGDLLRPDLLFINRQRGSGTRILLDYELSRRGWDGSLIRGYDREEYTHMGVAAAVASGAADVGLGILSAAVALGLDFIPVADEEYELIAPAGLAEEPLLLALRETLRSEAFRRELEALGGYDCERTGEESWLET